MLKVDQEGNFFKITAIGTLTPKDYEDLTPAIDKAVREYGSIKALLNLEAFEGWELEAAWDDFKLGMHYRDTFTKVAIVGNKTWEEWIAKLSHFLMPGDVKYFTVADLGQAEAWVQS